MPWQHGASDPAPLKQVLLALQGYEARKQGRSAEYTLLDEPRSRRQCTARCPVPL
jgi:hypothetical protein